MKTAEELIDEHGPNALLVAAAELTYLHGQTPFTFWRVELEPEWTLLVNGTAHPQDGLPPWHGTVLYGGRAIVVFNAATGVQVPGLVVDGLDAEAAALTVLERAIARASHAVDCLCPRCRAASIAIVRARYEDRRSE